MRVRVGDDVRAVGEVSSWPSTWDLSGSDVWVPVTASGILRRLGQGASPLQSPYVRWVLSGCRIIPSLPVQGLQALSPAFRKLSGETGDAQTVKSPRPSRALLANL